MRNAPPRADQAVSAPTAPSSASPRNDITRRRFLFALGAGGAGAVAVAAAPAAAVVDAPKSGTAEALSGYRETGHIRDYYDSARL